MKAMFCQNKSLLLEVGVTMVMDDREKPRIVP